MLMWLFESLRKCPVVPQALLLEIRRCFPSVAVCGCSAVGTLPGGCDSSGRCFCKAEFTGPRCEQCSSGHHSYPHCYGKDLRQQQRDGNGLESGHSVSPKHLSGELFAPTEGERAGAVLARQLRTTSGGFLVRMCS